MRLGATVSAQPRWAKVARFGQSSGLELNMMGSGGCNGREPELRLRPAAGSYVVALLPSHYVTLAVNLREVRAEIGMVNDESAGERTMTLNGPRIFRYGTDRR